MKLKRFFFNKGFNNITTFIYFVSIISTSILTGISAEIGFNPYLGFAEKVSPKFMPLLTKNFLTNQ